VLENPSIVRLSFPLLICALLLGCASEGTRPIDPSVDLSSPDGTRRAHAVQAAGASGDQRYVPELIPMLDDDDETIRLQVSAVLKELTEFDTGYEPFADRAVRSAHVQRWEAWWAEKSEASASTPVSEGRQP
jgi:HEAT repeat protein